MRPIIVVLTLAAGAVLAAVALATPPSPPPTLTAETARGTFAEPLKVNTKLAKKNAMFTSVMFAPYRLESGSRKTLQE